MRNVFIDKIDFDAFFIEHKKSPSPASLNPSKHELPIKLNYFLILRHHKNMLSASFIIRCHHSEGI